MCKFSYKIISKVLVNRLKRLLSDLITPFQSAFIAGRQIHDNMLVAHKFFHYIRINNQTDREECTIKVDMQKAYDRLE